MAYWVVGDKKKKKRTTSGKEERQKESQVDAGRDNLCELVLGFGQNRSM